MTTDNRVALHEAALFANLDRAGLERVAALARRRAFRRDEVVFRQEDPPGPVYVITSGRVKIAVVSREGKESVLAYLSPSDSLGELGALSNLPRSVDAVAVEPTETLYFLRDDFLGLVNAIPAIALQLIRQAARRLRATDGLVGDMVFYDVPGRVAKRLLDLAKDFGVMTEQGMEIQLPMTQRDLANAVGSTREMVNRVLKHYKARGYVDQRGDRLIILRPEALERLT